MKKKNTNTSGHWIEKKLSFEERNRLITEILAATSSPTSKQILDKVKELFPEKTDYPSLWSITDWKAKRWDAILQRMELLHFMKINGVNPQI